MIEASFDPRKTNTASVSGAVQYDTGQRLRLLGLPSPEELAEKDDFLSGDVVSVQVQFAYKDDSQTESRIALYDESEGVWMCAVPDAYLQKSYPVGFFVYVGYGATEESQRSKTMYTGSFTPQRRPAPGDQVTPDQLDAWDALVQEVNLAISGTLTATSNANAAASNATTSADNADASAQRADAAAAVASRWGNATVSATTLPEGSAATATLSERDGNPHITYGIPVGRTGPAGVTFRLDGTTLYIDTE